MGNLNGLGPWESRGRRAGLLKSWPLKEKLLTLLTDRGGYC